MKKTHVLKRIKFEIISSLYLIFGLLLGSNFIKPIEGTENLWELRPLRDRIFFVTWENDGFVLLHHFQKTTQKTPRREIEQALREIEDLKERGL